MRSVCDATAIWFMGKNNSRWEYALWHCKRGKLSDIGYENLKPTIKNISDDWKRTYRNKPIEKH